LLLLPLSAAGSQGIRIGRFMGGKHTTFNMGLWDREFAAAAGLSDLNVLLAALREHANLDLLSLTQQPLHWRGRQNPFALLPHQPSINRCPLLLMSPGGTPASRISNSFRRRLKGKERKLQALPGYRYHVAASDDEIRCLLDWFFQVKPLRMAAQKLPNVFSEPGVEAFIRAACLAPRGDGRVVEMHALECDEEVIAMFAGVTDGHRFSMMFNSYTMSEHARYSPGLILLRSIIDRYGERGFGAIDLGMGADDYKRLFCKSDELIFDSFIPLSARGRLVTPVMAAANHGKRLVKQNEPLFALARRLRSALR
jgi:CelD/BcsL family acetyltransferase involved in cellulose biosynthesis